MALLEDIGGGISNFFGGLLGGGGQTGQTAEGVQPQQQADLLSMLSPDDQKRMMYSMLGQIGSTLLAAGQKQMPQQRAQYLAQLGSIPGNVQREAMTNLQGRMLQSQLAERLQNQQSLAQISNLMKDPAAFKQAYGFDLPPGVSAAQVQNIVQQRATSQYVNPLARQIQEAQYADILANREKAITALEAQKANIASINGDTSQIDAQINTLRRIYGAAPAPAAAAPTPALVTPAAPAAAPAVTPGGVVQPSAHAAAPTSEQPSAAPVTPPAAPASLFNPPSLPRTTAEAGASIFSQFPNIPRNEVFARLKATGGDAAKFSEELAKLATDNRKVEEAGGLEGRAQNLILSATKDPKIAETPEYSVAFNRMYGPKMVTTFNPATQQMEYAWTSPPIPQGVIPPKGLIQQPATAGTEVQQTGQAAGLPVAQAPAPGTTAPLIAQRPPEEKPLTEDQARATGFAARMIQASKITDPLDFSAAAKPGLVETLVGPKIGPIATNIMRDEDRQRYRQAQENWVRANLRKESGAVIGVDEMAKEIENYFPQQGDTNAVIEQKRKNREAATQGMITAAGPGAKRQGLEFKPYEPGMIDRINSATPQELLTMNTDDMTEQEKAAYAVRLNRLNRGR